MLLNAFRFVDKQSYSYRALTRRGPIKNPPPHDKPATKGGVSGRLGGWVADLFDSAHARS